MTPARAIAVGADYLVVGRPVMEAADPRAAADGIQSRDRAGAGLTGRKETKDGKGLLGSRGSMFTTWMATRNTSRRNGAVFNKYGRSFWCVADRFVGQEGSSRTATWYWNSRIYETALACYNSPEYARWSRIRSPMPKATS